jgi:hypothetical protein
MVMRLLKLCSLLLGGLFLICSLIYIFSPKDVNRGFRYYINNLVGIRCIDYRQGSFSRKLDDRIPEYISKSSVSGIAKCKDKDDLLKKVSEGKLFLIVGGYGYIIEKMSHSYPYLTGDGKDLIAEIGKRFREKISATKLKGSSFRITSMTRTTDILKKLREVNSNASPSSPHLYGNALDISYIRFSTPKWFVTSCDKKYLKDALAEVIWQLREEKKCWATYEIKQSCFHVVAR